MDTWAKKFKYSKWNKLVAILILCVMAIGIVQGLFTLMITDQYDLMKQSYFETSECRAELISKAGYVRDWIVRYNNPEIFQESSIEEEQIQSYIQGIIEQEENLEGLSEQEIDDARKKMREDPAIRKKAIDRILQDRHDYYEKIQRQLVEEKNNIIFLARDTETGKVLSNISAYPKNSEDIIKELIGKPCYIKGDAENVSYITQYGITNQDFYGNEITYGGHPNYYEGQNMPESERSRYEIYLGIKEPLAPITGDTLYEGKTSFDLLKEAARKILPYLIVSLGIGIIAMIYLTYAAGRSAEQQGIQLVGIDKIPFEIQGFSLLIELFLLAKIFMGVTEVYRLTQDRILQAMHVPFFMAGNITTTSVMWALVSLVILAGLSTLVVYMSVIRHIKNHTFAKNFIIVKISISLYQGLLDIKRLPLGLALSLIAFVIGNLFLIFLIVEVSEIFLLLFLMVNIAAFVGIIKLAMDYQKLILGAERIAKGEVEYKINLGYTLPAMRNFAGILNRIGEGLEQAVRQTMKSERMKTELITNVSHDLKTPLTSMITYIDLLEEEEIENQNAKDYITVLSERSERLKQLIEDLVEASKATTGNIGVEFGTVQFHQLVEQVVGEYEDRLKAREVEIIISKIEPVDILADGRHMWRILENIISNIMKYAMPHTRAYIEVTKQGDYGMLTLKNISKDPLNIDPSELTERFVRGDESRSEEGSGLGLAIAQSLTHLQKGMMEITIDGDLFKIMIKIPRV